MTTDQKHGNNLFIYMCLLIWATSSISTIALFFFSIPLALGSLLIALASGYPIFKNTLNKVQAIGPVYWITRDYCVPSTPFICRGFMHEVDPPWRKGKGIQVRVGSRTFQVGLCRKHNHDEVDGVLAAMDGRFLDLEPKEIGNWK